MSVGVWAAGDAAERDDGGRLARSHEVEEQAPRGEPEAAGLPANVADLGVFADREGG